MCDVLPVASWDHPDIQVCVLQQRNVSGLGGAVIDFQKRARPQTVSLWALVDSDIVSSENDLNADLCYSFNFIILYFIYSTLFYSVKISPVDYYTFLIVVVFFADCGHKL